MPKSNRTGRAKTTTKASPSAKASASSQPPSQITIKLQIAAAVFVPMLAIGLWLNSKGFFG